MKRIPLSNNEFEGNNNSYLYREKSTILIDTGISLPDTEEKLRESLSEYGVDFSDIDAILLTHWHGDHVGLAGTIQDESGAEVYIGDLDAPLLSEDEDVWLEMREIRTQRLEQWGMPTDKKDELNMFLDSGLDIMGKSPELNTVNDGDVLSFGDLEFSAHHTPGHTDGHISYSVHRNGEDEIHTGDALLPVYTPNVGGADLRVEKPLDKYLDTLEWISNSRYSVAYPGHRDPIKNPQGRAREIIEHHRDRAVKIIDILRDSEPLTAWEIGHELFGELESIHIMHGPGESYAHLDHMERNDIVNGIQSSEGSAIRYKLNNNPEQKLRKTLGDK